MTFGWKMKEKILKDNNNILIRKVFAADAGSYSCFVNCTCGFFESPTCTVTVESEYSLLPAYFGSPNEVTLYL